MMKARSPDGFSGLFRLPCFLTATGFAGFLLVCVLSFSRTSAVLSSSGALHSAFRGGSVLLPVSVTIFGRSSDTISGRVAFFLPDGKPAGAVERSWQGWYLTLECLVLTFRPGEKKCPLVFPSLFRPDGSGEKSAFRLFDSYDSEGFPLIYRLPGLSAEEDRALRTAFALAKAERIFPGLFSCFSRQQLKIRSFSPGTEYNLAVESGGTVFLSLPDGRGMDPETGFILP